MTRSMLMFTLSITLATGLPLLALWWLQPLLSRVLLALCQADGGGGFWLRTAQILAVSGSLILFLVFGPFDEQLSLLESLRRTLALTMVATFFSVSLISRQVWAQVRRLLAATDAATPPNALPPAAQ